MSCSPQTTSCRSDSTSGRASEPGTGVTRPTQRLAKRGLRAPKGMACQDETTGSLTSSTASHQTGADACHRICREPLARSDEPAGVLRIRLATIRHGYGLGEPSAGEPNRDEPRAGRRP